jgi:hypothetical protein
MIPEKGIRFVEMIMKRTKEGQLKWKPTSEETCFSADFPEYTLEAQEFLEEGPRGDYSNYLLQIRDSQGRIIDTIRPRDFDDYNFSGYKELQTIYEWARSAALGIDAAYDKIMSILGNDSDGGDNTLEEEIPF